jgi:hypothetical protein
LQRAALRLSGETHKARMSFIPLKRYVRPYLVWFRHHGLTPDDVVIASYPRSGSTWLRFLLFEILSGEDAHFESVNRALPYVGWHKDASRLLPNGGRLMQSHERFTGGISKAIYIVRDVRSVVLSEYRLAKMYGYTGDFSSFLGGFTTGEANAFGSPWSDHVNFWLDSSLAVNGGMLLLRYEDMRNDIQATLGEVLGFLGLASDPRVISRAIRNNELSEMRIKEQKAPARELHKANSSIPFIADGSISGWQTRLSPEELLTLERASASAMYRLGYSSNGAQGG